MGSPPRVRGKESLRQIRGRAGRITPACAGKRFSLCPERLAEKDHPRVCGEKPMCKMFLRPVPGSPPRVRGKELQFRNPRACKRITPACAGKRWQIAIGWYPEKDHPRVCGEKTKNLPVARFFSLIRNGSRQVHVTSHITDSLSGSLTVLCAHLHME